MPLGMSKFAGLVSIGVAPNHYSLAFYRTYPSPEREAQGEHVGALDYLVSDERSERLAIHEAVAGFFVTLDSFLVTR